MVRFDKSTKYGPLGIGVEIISTDIVDNYDTLDFTVTIHTPYGFGESSFCSQIKDGKRVIAMQTSRQMKEGK